MSQSFGVFAKIPFFGSKGSSTEQELSNLKKYEKIIDEENRIDNKNIFNVLTKPARRALSFGVEFGRCYDTCAAKALRSELLAAGIEATLPSHISDVASKDLLTLDRNAGEEELNKLVGEVTAQDLSKKPHMCAPHVVHAQLHEHIKKNTRAKELVCEADCAKKYLHLLKG